MAKYPTVSFFQTLAHVDDPRNKTIPWFDLAGVQYAVKTTSDLSKWIYASKGMWNGNAVGVRREIYDQIGYVIDECIAGCCDCAFNPLSGEKSFLKDWILISFFLRFDFFMQIFCLMSFLLLVIYFSVHFSFFKIQRLFIFKKLSLKAKISRILILVYSIIKGLIMRL